MIITPEKKKNRLEEDRFESEKDRDELEQNRFDFENRRVNDQPVNCCPHCGHQLKSAPGIQAPGDPQDAGLGPEDSIKKAVSDIHTKGTSPETAAIPPGKPNDPPGDRVEPVEPLMVEPPASSRKWPWILLAIMGVGFLGYLIFLINTPQHSSIPTTGQSLPEPKPSDLPKREATRVLALEALRQGTILSVTISKLPKLEKVVQAAQKLQDISPRYQTQVTTAEGSLRDAHDKRDKILMAYLGKVLELGRYSPEQISYALETMRNGDLTPREMIVVELLANHLKSSLNNVKPDPANWLSDFTERFSGFLD